MPVFVVFPSTKMFCLFVLAASLRSQDCPYVGAELSCLEARWLHDFPQRPCCQCQLDPEHSCGESDWKDFRSSVTCFHVVVVSGYSGGNTRIFILFFYVLTFCFVCCVTLRSGSPDSISVLRWELQSGHQPLPVTDESQWWVRGGTKSSQTQKNVAPLLKTELSVWVSVVHMALHIDQRQIPGFNEPTVKLTAKH